MAKDQRIQVPVEREFKKKLEQVSRATGVPLAYVAYKAYEKWLKENQDKLPASDSQRP